MIKILKKFLFILISIFFIFESSTLSNINSEIVVKINNEIITNIDVEKEKKFLIFLNPKLKNLSNTRINEISKKSLINRTIKKIELEKYFDLKVEKLGEVYVKNFISNSSFSNLEVLKNELKNSNIDYNFFEDNFKIDNLWREFIYNKFKSRVKLNIQELKKKTNNITNEIEELNLSEILFDAKNEQELVELKDKIFKEINKSGFEVAASIYSKSDSKSFGGKLGWIRSSQMSKYIYSFIKDIRDISEPIKTNNGYLIIKINEKRKIFEKINKEVELKKLVKSETEKEINKQGYIFFNKIKKRIFISEK